MGKIICFVALSLFVFSFCFAQTNEQITIVTYYPSPTGSYHELHVDQLAVGTGYRATTPPANSLIVEGSIGINTGTAVGARLHVGGPVRIVDGTQGVGKVLTSDANGVASWRDNVYAQGGWYGFCTFVFAAGVCTGGVFPPITCSGAPVCPAGFTLNNFYNNGTIGQFVCMRN